MYIATLKRSIVLFCDSVQSLSKEMQYYFIICLCQKGGGRKIIKNKPILPEAFLNLQANPT